jgi:hypothetical protein
MSSVYIGNSEPNIILLGDMMLDHNIKGYCNKIANEGPIPVVNVNNETNSIDKLGKFKGAKEEYNNDINDIITLYQFIDETKVIKEINNWGEIYKIKLS